MRGNGAQLGAFGIFYLVVGPNKKSNKAGELSTANSQSIHGYVHFTDIRLGIKSCDSRISAKAPVLSDIKFWHLTLLSKFSSDCKVITLDDFHYEMYYYYYYYYYYNVHYQ